ncbi:hypothetical protein [uncultured Polaribacter sp.]|uniref:hypothetical protein n=1 Tax=uncultured Polaribacter sp. TaxID=174711 RepID=UPI0026142080|nr:hypothetical protein [uncultured Polaribacter sp.]
MIILETIRTHRKFFNFKHPKIYMYIGLFVAFMAVIAIIIIKDEADFDSLSNTFYTISTVAFLFFSISGLLNRFLKDDILITKTGKIKVTTAAFLIDEITIPFEEVTVLDCNILDYSGRTSNSGILTSMYSAGTDNFITIKTENTEIKKQVLINSDREIALLFNFLGNQIVLDKFSKMNPKKMIGTFTADFRKTEKARNYIAKEIKNGTLKTTEGLLMMNYASDNEAKELRAAYNL